MKRICDPLHVAVAALAVLLVAVPCARADLVGYWTFDQSVACKTTGGSSRKDRVPATRRCTHSAHTERATRADLICLCATTMPPNKPGSG
ncbi:MAG: hypothetical protein HQ567_15435 [Candidatus Nealsonbacteria bacterium]|nr:hypothetical protein [Candidatus Nealsonbacteria bacterium]